MIEFQVPVVTLILYYRHNYIDSCDTFLKIICVSLIFYQIKLVTMVQKWPKNLMKTELKLRTEAKLWMNDINFDLETFSSCLSGTDMITPLF